eukprot:GHVT01104871.1.p2 GENE.GHVT01104871.1~~GHVT01104871.1.p2  ORF type:complete len:294 (-),score=29.30 GHVT01104871.1:697-1578(-)
MSLMCFYARTFTIINTSGVTAGWHIGGLDGLDESLSVYIGQVETAKSVPYKRQSMLASSPASFLRLHQPMGSACPTQTGSSKTSLSLADDPSVARLTEYTEEHGEAREPLCVLNGVLPRGASQTIVVIFTAGATPRVVNHEITVYTTLPDDGFALKAAVNSKSGPLTPAQATGLASDRNEETPKLSRRASVSGNQHVTDSDAVSMNANVANAAESTGKFDQPSTFPRENGNGDYLINAQSIQSKDKIVCRLICPKAKNSLTKWHRETLAALARGPCAPLLKRQVQNRNQCNAR